MMPPKFWSQQKPGVMATLLTPLSAIWLALGAGRTRRATPYRASIPVICIGNATIGGAGKTPVAIDLGHRLLGTGAKPHFLSRGYGGRTPGPTLVDAAMHDADDVGDEPLLLSRVAPTWVARNRVAGAKAAEAAGATHIIMDDGFQNPALHKDFSILVVDGGAGFGNGCVIPAGPLREPIDAAIARAQIVVILGSGDAPGLNTAAADIPVLRADINPIRPDSLAKGAKVMAFAGIGRPQKFFQTARDMGLSVMEVQAFPDHYRYRPSDFKILHTVAAAVDGRLITTEKDLVRVPTSFQAKITAIPITLEWHNNQTPEPYLRQAELLTAG